MQVLQMEDWILEIDLERTKAYYSQRPSFAETCGCTYCRNFVSACQSFSQSVMLFFGSLGIDPTKEAGEIYENCINEDSTHFYGGWYHIVGKIMKGKDCRVPSTNWSDMKLHKVDGFKFGFTNKLELPQMISLNR